MHRNAVVHSFWTVGTHEDPDVILGIRYKVRNRASGGTATVSIGDVPGSERKQDTVQYRLDELRKLLKHDIATMRVGEIAYAEVNLTWASQHVLETDEGALST